MKGFKPYEYKCNEIGKMNLHQIKNICESYSKNDAKSGKYNSKIKK